MINYVMPVVGATGLFVLKPPFNAKMPAEVVFTCESVRSIKDYVAQNQDILQEVYVASTLTEADYELAVQNDIPIVALRADQGQWIYIPADYIEKYPTVDGVMYRQIMFGVSTPPIDSSVDLVDLSTKIQQLVTDYIGRACEVNTMELTVPFMLTMEAHAAEKAIRDAAISRQPPALAIIRNLQTLTASQAQHIQALEAAILNP